VIDVATRRIVRSIALGPERATGTVAGVTAVSPLGTEALVGNLQVDLGAPAGVLNVVNLRSDRLESPIRLPAKIAGTRSIAFDCDGSSAFAVTGTGLVRVEIATRRASPVTGQDLSFLDLDGVARTPDGDHLWLASSFELGCPDSCASETQFLPLDPTSTAAGAPVGDLPWNTELFAVGPPLGGG